MYRYILKRILMMIPVLIAVSFVVYFLMDLAPGDIISSMAPQDATEAEIEMMREELGLNGPLIQRYFRYLGNLLKGDMGMSLSLKRPVAEVFFERFPATLQLALAATVVAVVIAIPLGIAAATHHRSFLDGFSMVTAMLGVSMPGFWLALLLIMWFSLGLKWFPSGGSGDFKHLVLPSLALGAGQAGTLTRITRSSMLDVIRQDYLRTARAKGVSEKQVIRKHALKNALIPIITVFGSTFGNLLGGAVAIETVFSWPGIGRLTVSAVNTRDITLATGCIIMFTVILTVTMLLVDIAYAFVDPRIKAQYTK
ncbi:MAG: ABC transporter permease [Eubacteriales bacterium]|nr:ABC transporter permease [Eubacteriales bacterium]